MVNNDILVLNERSASISEQTTANQRGLKPKIEVDDRPIQYPFGLISQVD